MNKLDQLKSVARVVVDLDFPDAIKQYQPRGVTTSLSLHRMINGVGMVTEKRVAGIRWFVRDQEKLESVRQS